MSRYTLAVVAVLLTGLVTTTTTATPPRSGAERNGLTPSETASLWSRDSDDYITQAEYEERYGETRSAMAQVANGTDITYTRPPRTAATWTRHDFQDLAAGDAATSIHPPDASLSDGAYIQDAHASVFGVHPSTRAHRAPGDTPLYVAPSGTVRGFVDYRIRTGNNSSVVAHEVTGVRLLADGTPVNTTANTQTPVLGYQLADSDRVTLTLEADITARIRTAARNGTNVSTVESETVTVRDSLAVRVYDLRVQSYRAVYPDGDRGVAVFQSLPWQGYTLTPSGSRRVRGVWRFYTARDPDWDALIESTATGTSRRSSPAVPVFVHAYPSRIGPRAEPVRAGPRLVDVWGPTKPEPGFGERIQVDSVDRPYTASYGLALRSTSKRDIDLRVAGIVRGVNATTPSAGGSTRRIRNSTLTATIVDQTASHARVRLELRDAVTGAPIALASSRRMAPLDGAARDGYLVVDGTRVETNSTGVATVTLQNPGVYSVRYEPGSWTDHDPAYVSDTATVRWHPLTTLDGWLALTTTSLWLFAPFLVALYLGHRIHRFFTLSH